MDPGKKILLDADVVIHFHAGGLLNVLPDIFPNDYLISDIILEVEILPGPLNDELLELLELGKIDRLELEPHPLYFEIITEYSKLLENFGKGESVCMAYCRFTKDVIGSSNLSDILEYCRMYSIPFLTTMDFLLAAFEKKILNEQQCNEFVAKNLSRGSKLPCNTFSEFLRKRG